MTTENQVAETAVVLTAEQKLEAKINASREKIEKLVEQHGVLAQQHNDLVAELNALRAITNVAAGDRVDAVIGRGEKAVTLVNAEVLGVSEDENGKRVKVQSGIGFDTRVDILTAAQIKRVITRAELDAALEAGQEQDAAE